MNESIAVDHPHGSEPSSQLRIRFNTRSAKRMIEDNVYPKTVDIPPDAFKGCHDNADRDRQSGGATRV